MRRVGVGGRRRGRRDHPRSTSSRRPRPPPPPRPRPQPRTGSRPRMDRLLEITTKVWSLTPNTRSSTRAGSSRHTSRPLVPSSRFVSKTSPPAASRSRLVPITSRLVCPPSPLRLSHRALRPSDRTARLEREPARARPGRSRPLLSFFQRLRLRSLAACFVSTTSNANAGFGGGGFAPTSPSKRASSAL